MGRPREFDENDALSNAMDVFWEHGFEGASLPDLLDGMQLTRGSLYKAFADKKNLFLLVIEKYELEMVAPVVALLTDEKIPDGAQRIEQLFAGVLDAVKSGDNRGCLLCTTAAGAASIDREIADKVHDMISAMQGGFEISISHSKVYAESDTDTHRKMAALLTTQYVGLRILARSKAPIDVLEQSIAGMRCVLSKP